MTQTSVRISKLSRPVLVRFDRFFFFFFSPLLDVTLVVSFTHSRHPVVVCCCHTPRIDIPKRINYNLVTTLHTVQLHSNQNLKQYQSHQRLVRRVVHHIHTIILITWMWWFVSSIVSITTSCSCYVNANHHPSSSLSMLYSIGKLLPCQNISVPSLLPP